MKYLRVERRLAEEARRRLMGEGALDASFSVERAGGYVFFPLRSMSGAPGDVVELAGVRRTRRPRSLKEALAGELTEAELSILGSSYSVVGDIAMVELDESLRHKMGVIGEAFLETFPNLKVVVRKTGQVSGEYRVPGVEVIAGENRTETVHREHGCVYRVDVAKTYFSPRLSRERMRVVNQIVDGERVLVLFAGVGPYAVLAAKSRRCDVTAVELNPKAVEYMRWNVLKNRVKVDVVLGDAREVLPSLGRFDRIVMPLPKQADTFLDVAAPAVADGGVVHYYVFAHGVGEAEEKLRCALRSLGKMPEVLASVVCGSYSPCLSRVCVDFRLCDL